MEKQNQLKTLSSGLTLVILLIGSLSLAFHIDTAKAWEGPTIHIRADGSIDPPTAPIQGNGDIYMLTDDIYTFIDNDAIVIERDNMILDGAGFTINGRDNPRSGSYNWGIKLWNRNNVTIGNFIIHCFGYGCIDLSQSFNIRICRNTPYQDLGGCAIYLNGTSDTIVESNNVYGDILCMNSSNNTIVGNSAVIYLMNSSDNRVIRNACSIYVMNGSMRNIIDENTMGGWCILDHSNNNVISNNNITMPFQKYEEYPFIRFTGIALDSHSDRNLVRGNNITNGWVGINLVSGDNKIIGNTIGNAKFGIFLSLYSNSNTVSENAIIDNIYGLWLEESSSNRIFHNILARNDNDASIIKSYGDMWDGGYPLGGNYWENYTDVDSCCGPDQNISGSDGIWDHPYIIDRRPFDTNYTDHYPLVKPYAPGNLSLVTYTDKTTYHAGDVMHLGLNATNHDSVKYVCFAIWCELPSGSTYLYIHMHSVVVQIGLEYTNPTLRTITLPSLPPGTYKWHAALLDRSTHEIIIEDRAEWQFS